MSNISQSVTVSWNSPTITDDFTIQFYNIISNDENGVTNKILSTTSTNSTFDQYNSGTYTYTVQAVLDNGMLSPLSEPSNPLIISIKPSQPAITNVVLSGLINQPGPNISNGATGQQVDISWNAPINMGGNTIANYVIISTSGNNFTTLSNNTSFTITETASNSFRYAVLAVTVSGISGLTSPRSSSININISPDSPQIISSIVSATYATISWLGINGLTDIYGNTISYYIDTIDPNGIIINKVSTSNTSITLDTIGSYSVIAVTSSGYQSIPSIISAYIPTSILTSDQFDALTPQLVNNLLPSQFVTFTASQLLSLFFLAQAELIMRIGLLDPIIDIPCLTTSQLEILIGWSIICNWTIIQISSINAIALSNVSPNAFSSISPIQLTGLTQPQLTLTTNSQLVALNVNYLFQSLTSQQIQWLSHSQFMAALYLFSGLQLSALSFSQIQSINDVDIPSLNGLVSAMTITFFTPHQILLFSDNILRSLTQSQVGELIIAQIVELAGNQLNDIGSIATTQFDALIGQFNTTTDIPSLITDQLNVLFGWGYINLSNWSTLQIAAVDPTQLSNVLPNNFSRMSQNQLTGLTQQQLTLTTNSQLVALNDNYLFQSLTSQQIQWLSHSQFMAALYLFSGLQLSALSFSQIQSINDVDIPSLNGLVSAMTITFFTPHQISLFSNSQLASLTYTQVVSLNAAQREALNVSQLNYLMQI